MPLLLAGLAISRPIITVSVLVAIRSSKAKPGLLLIGFSKTCEALVTTAHLTTPLNCLKAGVEEMELPTATFIHPMTLASSSPSGM